MGSRSRWRILRRILRSVIMLGLISPVAMPAVAPAPAACMTSATEVHEQESADQQDPEPVCAEVSQHHSLPSISCVFSTLAEIDGVPAQA
jgi:hypothetical protein